MKQDKLHRGDEIYETIESYLLHKLPADERIIFESQLQANPEFARQLEAQKVEHMVMDVLVENHLRGKFKIWKAEAEALEQEEKPDDKEPAYRNYWLGGIMVILLSGGIFFLSKYEDNSKKIKFSNDILTTGNKGDTQMYNSKQNNIPAKFIDSIKKENKLDTINRASRAAVKKDSTINPEKAPPAPQKKEPKIKENKTPRIKQDPTPQPTIDPISTPQLPVKEQPETTVPIDTLRHIAANFAQDYHETFTDTRSTENKTILDQALQNLEDGDYDAGITKLVEIVNLEEEHRKAAYYLGMAYCQIGDFQKAIPHLETIAQTVYKQTRRAQWELSLAYLQTGNLGRAKFWLNKIIAVPTHSHIDNAKELLEKLKTKGL